MDAAFNQHAPHSRDKNRSHTNINRLTLAPLTSRLPLLDPEYLPESDHHFSYIEGRSAPTTPSILKHSVSHLSAPKSLSVHLPKSKSSTHLLAAKKEAQSCPNTPGGARLRNGVKQDELGLSTLSANDRTNSDWLLRAGATMTTSARESKGQAWLLSRASSTSLAMQDDEEDHEIGLAREREQYSRRNSRRGSLSGDPDECSPFIRRSSSFGYLATDKSRPTSRLGSRVSSRRGSRTRLLTPTPIIIAGDDYFDHQDFDQEELITEPDFVDLDENEDVEGDPEQQEDATIRYLARATSEGLGGWIEKMLGWSLFSEEDEDDVSDTMNEKEEDYKGEGPQFSRRPSRVNVHSSYIPVEVEVPPPSKDEEVDGWQDAAWLLSVATKVLL